MCGTSKVLVQVQVQVCYTSKVTRPKTHNIIYINMNEVGEGKPPVYPVGPLSQSCSDRGVESLSV